jgi:hypothetical protein
MDPITTAPDNVAIAALSDDELVEQVKDLAACERRASVALIRSLVEFDTRRLYLREGCSSLLIDAADRRSRAAQICPCGVTAAG